MKKGIIILSLALSLFSCEQDKWQPLFNGQDLDGWLVKGEDATFEVIEEQVVGTNQGRNNTFLATEKRYTDFILELEVWVDQKMNSGIQFRSNQKKTGRVFGYQAEIDPSSRAYSGGIYDEARRDWLYPLSLNPAGQQAFKNNEWNRYRIEAYGNSMRVWVNDICTAVLEDDLTSDGFIALQVHGVGTKEEEGRQVKWRNARILTSSVEDQLKPLPVDMYQLNLVTHSMTEHEENQGWQWFYHPETLEEMFAKEVGWKWSDGQMSSDTTHGIFMGIGFERKDLDFEFSFQFKIDSSASGYLGYWLDQSGGRRYRIFDPSTGFEGLKDRMEEQYFVDIPLENLSHPPMGTRYRKPLGTWNQGRIIVRSGKAQHWMNGFKIAEFPVDNMTGSALTNINLEWVRGNVDFTNFKIRFFEP